MEIKNIQLKVYQWYIKKRVFVYRNQREKELGPCSKTRESPCAIALFLLNMIE